MAPNKKKVRFIIFTSQRVVISDNVKITVLTKTRNDLKQPETTYTEQEATLNNLHDQ